MTLKPLTVPSLVAEQREAPFRRWKHFDRVLRRLEEIHEMTQHERQREAREHLMREAALLPKTRASIAELWSEAQSEIDVKHRPHVVERVIRPIPLKERSA